MNKSEYKSYIEWKKAKLNDYTLAYVHGYLDDICDYYGWDKQNTSKQKPAGYWTKERCIEDALKYETRTEWDKKGRGSVSSAKRNDWYKECTKHMLWVGNIDKPKKILKNKPAGYWKIKENVLAEAKKYKTRTEWKRGNHPSILSARNNGWMNEATEHMKIIKKPNGYWTKERVLEDANNYNSKKDWKFKSSGSQSSARDNGWYDEATEHMK